MKPTTSDPVAPEPAGVLLVLESREQALHQVKQPLPRHYTSYLPMPQTFLPFLCLSHAYFIPPLGGLCSD